MNAEEFVLVTKAFLNRLYDRASCAGCNDLCEDEFPKSVCDKYGSDFALLDEWKKSLESIIEENER